MIRLLVPYLVGVPITALVIGYLDPPVDGEEQFGVGMMALCWPVVAVVGGFLGAVYLIGWLGRWAGRR
jgi:hypothetical protein